MSGEGDGRKAGLFVMREKEYEWIYGDEWRHEAGKRLRLVGPPMTREQVLDDLSVVADVQVVLSGWGGPRLDAQFLEAAPALELVLYGAGSIRGIATPESWDRGVRIVSGWGMNAVAVAEYTLSQILFCLKSGWRHVLEIKRGGGPIGRLPMAGAYGSTVGVVSLGMVGRRVCELLRGFDLQVIAYDPFADDAEMGALGARKVDLDTIFRESDVVTLHTPLLLETTGMITGAHLAAMKEGAALINTSRGAVVRENEMIEVLTQRPDLTAVLDVTNPEPPVEGSPLYSLPNVVLTPHIAGAIGLECRRMGRAMIEDLDRYLAGAPLQWEVTRERAAVLA